MSFKEQQVYLVIMVFSVVSDFVIAFSSERAKHQACRDWRFIFLSVDVDA